MNFGEAVEVILRRLKRPDKTEDAQDSINRAISIFATANFYADLAETQIDLAGQDYLQEVAINASPFSRFRKIKYLRPEGYYTYITWTDPSRIFTQGCEQLNTWYRSGNNLVFKLSSLADTAQVGYYQYHEYLVDDDDTDWMLDEMFPAVLSYALSELFQDIGDDATADRYTRRWPVLLQTFKEDIGDGVSHA